MALHCPAQLADGFVSDFIGVRTDGSVNDAFSDVIHGLRRQAVTDQLDPADLIVVTKDCAIPGVMLSSMQRIWFTSG